MNSQMNSADEVFMARALELAARGKGRAAPNPCVGAVLVRNGDVVAEGWHERFGDPHAEVNCLADAREKGVNPKGCTLYVTLEPCNHQGKTPPCTKAVLLAGIGKVVVGCADPNARVKGGGADFLRSKGVDVVVGVLERQCQDMIADFTVWQFTDRTYNILKMAATLDGRIAARDAKPARVSGSQSREMAHRMRERVDAVIVGGGTLRQDDPRLTARPGGILAQKQPLAVVVTSRLPDKGKILTLLDERPRETIFWTSGEAAGQANADALRSAGVRVWGLPGLPGPGNGLDLAHGFTRLRSETSCLTCLCEGGGRLAFSLLEQGVMDEFQYVLAPKVLGDEKGVPVFCGPPGGRSGPSMEGALRLRLCAARESGPDLVLTYRPARSVD